MPMRELYPDADILAQRGHWDDATRRVIMDRVHNVPSFQYFEPHERATLEALCARIIPQDHRPADQRVPIAPWIDQRCQHRMADGFRFDDMPENDVAWTWGLAGLDEAAELLHGGLFAELAPAAEERVLEAVRRGEPAGEVWERMPPRRWWVFVALRQITAIYYAHPYAWDEIGFGGPAYPRGYFALNFGKPEPWEAREVGEVSR